LTGLMFLPPAAEFRVRFRQRERFGGLRILRVNRAGPAEQENVFGFVAVHGFGPWETSPVNPVAMSCANNRCNWPMPRARR